jgi:hypothetical protein
LLQVFKQKISFNDNMDITIIKTNYTYLIINSNANTSHIVKTNRLVSQIMKDTYNIQLSHMYIKRNLVTKDDYILTEGILIKMIW